MKDLSLDFWKHEIKCIMIISDRELLQKGAHRSSVMCDPELRDSAERLFKTMWTKKPIGKEVVKWS